MGKGKRWKGTKVRVGLDWIGNAYGLLDYKRRLVLVVILKPKIKRQYLVSICTQFVTCECMKRFEVSSLRNVIVCQ